MPKNYKSLGTDTRWILVSKNRGGTVILSPDVKGLVQDEYGRNVEKIVKRSLQIQFVPVQGERLGRCEVINSEVKKLLAGSRIWNTAECLLEQEISLYEPEPEPATNNGDPEPVIKRKPGRPPKVKDDSTGI